jgi:hypothetical protein
MKTSLVTAEFKGAGGEASYRNGMYSMYMYTRLSRLTELSYHTCNLCSASTLKDLA